MVRLRAVNSRVGNCLRNVMDADAGCRSLRYNPKTHVGFERRIIKNDYKI